MNVCALFRGVFDQHLIEDRAGHLPGDRALVMDGFEEIERARFPSRRVCKLTLYFRMNGLVLSFSRNPMRWKVQ